MKLLWLTVALSAATLHGNAQDFEAPTTISPFRKLIYKVETPEDFRDPEVLQVSDADVAALDELLSNKHDHGDEVFTMVYSHGKKVFQGRFNKLNESKEMWEFDQHVTSLTTDGEYVYASIHRWSFPRYIHMTHSQIWRAKLKNSEVDPHWEQFIVMDSYSDNILCMTAAKGKLWVGLDTGKILSCSAREQNTCVDFHNFDDDITAIDYDSVNNHVYASVDNGTVYKCPVNSGQSCTDIWMNSEVKGVTALKAGFNALWMGIQRGYSFWNDGRWPWERETWLYHRRTRLAPGEPDYATMYDNFFGQPLSNDYYIRAVDTTDRYVYFGLSESQQIWRCEPKTEGNSDMNCVKIISNAPQMNRFIIV